MAGAKDKVISSAFAIRQGHGINKLRGGIVGPSRELFPGGNACGKGKNPVRQASVAAWNGGMGIWKISLLELPMETSRNGC